MLLARKIKASAPQKEGGREILKTFLLCDPAGTSTKLTSRINGMTTHNTDDSSIIPVDYTSNIITHEYARLVNNKDFQ